MDAHANFPISNIATAPSPATSGTSLTVTAGQGSWFPSPAPFNATVWPKGGVPLVSNAEIVRVTAVSTDTFTITRAQEGTSARTIVVGDRIAANITKKTLTDLEDGVEISALSAAAQLIGTEKFPAYQGSGVVGVTGEQLTSTPFDTRRGAGGLRERAFEDFENAPATTADATVIAGTFTSVNRGGTGAGTNGQQGPLDLISGHVVTGVCGMTTGTTTTGRCAVFFGQGAAYTWTQTDMVRFLARIRIPTLSDGTDKFVVRAGLSDPASAAPTDGIYFEAQNGVTHWRAINRAASTSTDASTAITVATTYMNLAIVADGSTVHFYASSGTSALTEVVTQSTNRPANATILNPCVGIYKSAGTTARTVNVDTYAYDLPLSRGMTIRI